MAVNSKVEQEKTLVDGELYLPSLIILTCLHIIFFLFLLNIESQPLVSKDQVTSHKKISIRISHPEVVAEEIIEPMVIPEIVEPEVEVISEPVKAEVVKVVRQVIKPLKNRVVQDKSEDIVEVQQQDTQKIQDSYVYELVKMIKLKKTYPRLAKRFGQTGQVIYQFVINAQGQFGEFIKKQTSGHDILDEAALSLLAQFSGLNPLPKGIQNIPITIPVTYNLHDSK